MRCVQEEYLENLTGLRIGGGRKRELARANGRPPQPLEGRREAPPAFNSLAPVSKALMLHSTATGAKRPRHRNVS